MTCINDDEINKTAEYNLLHDIFNLPKQTKHLNIHCSPILRGCMNTIHGKEKFKNFQILLNSEFSSTIVVGWGVVKKLYLENMIQCSGTLIIVILLIILILK